MVRCGLISAVKRLLFAAGLALFFSHLVTCLWLLFAKLYDESADTWIVRKGIKDRSNTFQYLMGFYWTAQTVTTVGFGDIPAVTELEIALALIWMILGVGFYSYVIGNFSSMIASIDQKNRELQNQLTVLNQYSEQVNFPVPLERKIAVHLEQNVKKVDYQHTMQQILEELPPPLKIEVMNHTKGSIIHGLRFFQNKLWNFIWSVLPKLQSLIFMKNEIIYKEGDPATACYFILEGTVQFVNRSGLPFRKFFDRAHFGQYSILRSEPYRESTISETMSDLLMLHKSDLMFILEEYPRQQREIRKEAYQKQKILDQARKVIEEVVQEIPEDEPDSFEPRESDDILRRTHSLKKSQITEIEVTPAKRSESSFIIRRNQRPETESEDTKRESDSHKSSLFTEEGEFHSREGTKDFLKTFFQKKQRKSLFNSEQQFTKQQENMIQVMEKFQANYPETDSIPTQEDQEKLTEKDHTILEVLNTYNSSQELIRSSVSEILAVADNLARDQKLIGLGILEASKDIRKVRESQSRVEGRLDRM